jgi:hypothetical protein
LIYNPAKDKVEESLWKEEKQRSNWHRTQREHHKKIKQQKIIQNKKGHDECSRTHDSRYWKNAMLWQACQYVSQSYLGDTTDSQSELRFKWIINSKDYKDYLYACVCVYVCVCVVK